MIPQDSLLSAWSITLTQSFQELWYRFITFVPNLLLSIIIFVVGWVFGGLVSQWVARLIVALKLDRGLESLGVGELVSRAGYNLNSGKFIGEVARWFVVIAFLISALEVVGLQQVNIFLYQIVSFLPQVIVAALILLAAAVLANVTQRVVVASAKASGIAPAGLLGAISKWAIWVFSLITAFIQLGIAVPVLQTLFTGLVAMIAIAGGLAFGLGGKEAAARFLDKLHGDMSHR